MVHAEPGGAAASVHEAMSTLQMLAGGLCADAGIRLEASREGWYQVPGTGRIGVNLEDLRVWGVAVAAGVIAHECGHALATPEDGLECFLPSFSEAYREVWRSRGLPFPEGQGGDILPTLAHRFHNSVEDGRIESFMARRYPGCRAWFLHAAACLRGDSVLDSPRWMQFTLLLADLRTAPDAGAAQAIAADAGVLAQLDAHQADLAALRESTPTAALDGWRSVGADRAIQVHRAPRASAVSAAHAAGLGHTARLLRVFLELIAADASPEAGQGESEALLAAFAAAAGHCRAMRALPQLHVSGAWDTWRAPSAGSPSRAAPPGASPGPAPLAGVEALAAALRRSLAPVFSPAQPGTRRRVRAQGTRPHLPAVLRLEADPRASLAIWAGPPLPKARSAAVLLLVDLSGSMSGAKAAAAALAVEAVGRALAGLTIRVAVYGFQDKPFVLLPFGSPTVDALSTVGARIRAEPSASWPGGNNEPITNDDGPAVLAAAAALRARPEDERLLIVFSDGLPEAPGDATGRLRDAVARWSRPGCGLHLVGVGVGPGTRHVARYYPSSLAEVTPDDLPATLARLVRQRLTGGPAR
jgi:hypothetical protein